jgi:hypothetical protein
MILKGSERSGGQDLAVHLMRLDDNDHIELHELRGFTGDTLKEAFKEAEGASRGTRCRNYLFSLSLNPPEQESVSVETFEAAIQRIEERLNLSGQPRAIVFHEKEGRRHAHCVWSRIDAVTMTARQLPFFKNKLMEVSRDLYLEHGWKMPRGMIDAAARNPTNFTLAEWQQAKRRGMDPRWTKAVLQDCWSASDSRKAFEASLQSRGFWLARGDRRSFVVIDHLGEVHSLPRMLDVKAKDVRARLGEENHLPSVEATKSIIGQRMTPAIRRHIAESRERFQERAAVLGQHKTELALAHRAARVRVSEQQSLERDAAVRERAGRLPKGLKGLWFRFTGQYQRLRAEVEAEAARERQRHQQERQRVLESQREERAVLGAQFKRLRKEQAVQLLELRADVGRYLQFTRGAGHDTPARAQGRDQSRSLKLER